MSGVSVTDFPGAESALGVVTPERDTDQVVESQAVQFGEAARSLSGRARSLGLVTPVFKSPPRILGVSRTIRYRPDGRAVVAILFRNRPWYAVLADMIDGVVHINDLEGAQVSRARDDLWETFSAAAVEAA